MTSDDDAYASVVARGVAAASSWSLDEACARAAFGRHLLDVGGAVRDAAPCVLAVERWLASLPEGTPGATVVEMCGPESGHVAGMLLASILPPGAAREVVLVDARWPADAPSSSSSSLPVAHVDAPPVPGTYRAQLTRWKATTKNASHLRSLHRALRGATARDAAPLVVVSRRAPGTDALRAVQMYFAPAPGPVALVLEPGAPPDRVAAINGKLLYRAGPSHTFTARQIYPREGPRRHRRLGGDDDGAAAAAAASAADSPERRFARHLAVATSGATVDVDARPIVASRNAGDGVRTADDPFRPVALRVTDQMAEANAFATAAAATLDSFPLTDGTGRRVRLTPSVPGRWVAGGYADHHYVRQPPEPHGVCYEARVEPASDVKKRRDGDREEENGDEDGDEDVDENGDASTLVGFVAMSAYAGDGASELLLFEDVDDDASEDAGGPPRAEASPPRPGRALDAAQIDRLCVLPGYRGIGVKEALLRVADGFHAAGLPVRVKTASESAAKSFRRCALLAYEGFKDPTRAGVAKSRGVKTVVVVDGDDRNEATDATGTTNGNGNGGLSGRREDWRREDGRREDGRREDGRREDGRREDGRREAASRWGEDPEDARRYLSRDGWRRKNGNGDGGDGGDERSGADPRAHSPRRTAASALNRATPDTVPAVARAIRDALSTDPSDASATAFGATLARRAAREPSYRETYADIATRAETPSAATTAAAKIAANALTNASPGMGGETLAGHAAFLAALARRGAEAAASRVDDAVRALVAAATVEAGEDETSKANSMSKANSASKANSDVDRDRFFSSERLWDRTGRATAFEATCAAIEGGATRHVQAETRDAAAKVLATAAAPGCRLGGRARFLAERALDALRAEEKDENAAAAAANDPSTSSFPRRPGFGVGRGRPVAGAASASAGASSAASLSAPRGVLGAPSAMRRADVHAAASAEMRVVVAKEGSVAAAERGMRRGWMFRYVGSPVRRADGVEFTYVAAEEGERRGRWVRVERRDEPTETDRRRA